MAGFHKQLGEGELLCSIDRSRPMEPQIDNKKLLNLSHKLDSIPCHCPR